MDFTHALTSHDVHCTHIEYNQLLHVLKCNCSRKCFDGIVQSSHAWSIRLQLFNHWLWTYAEVTRTSSPSSSCLLSRHRADWNWDWMAYKARIGPKGASRNEGRHSHSPHHPMRCLADKISDPWSGCDKRSTITRGWCLATRKTSLAQSCWRFRKKKQEYSFPKNTFRECLMESYCTSTTNTHSPRCKHPEPPS